jgi:tRNA pseudouridine55 synthase
VHDAPPEEALLPVEAPLDDIPALYLTESEANRLRHGQSVVLFSKDGQNRLNAAGLDPHSDNGTVLARTEAKPVALVELNGVEVKPVRVLNV